MDELRNVTQQFVDAARIPGPTSYIPEVQGFARAGAMENAIGRGIGAGGALSGQRAKEADEADEAARRKRIQELSDKLDPSKYRRVRKDDGGFDFVDPAGNKIDVSTYADITNQRIVDVLKDSENPIDQEYINDWSNMNTLLQSMYNGDTDTVNAFVQQNPNLANLKPQDLMKELIKKYPHLYRTGTYQQTLNNRGSNAFSYNPNALYVPTTTSGGTGGGTTGGWSPS